jgi:hypothetical protein
VTSSDYEPNDVAPAQVSNRWRFTIRAARLGVVAATLLGMSMAFGIDGTPWGRVILAWCLGLPFSFPLAWVSGLSPNTQLGSTGAWGWTELALSASMVASWTSIGAIIDFALRSRSRARGSGTPPSVGAGGTADHYLKAAEREVEGLLGGPSGPPETIPRESGEENRRLLRTLSNETLHQSGALKHLVTRAITFTTSRGFPRIVLTARR